MSPLGAEVSEMHGNGRQQHWMWISFEIEIGEVGHLGFRSTQLDDVRSFHGPYECAGTAFVDTKQGGQARERALMHIDSVARELSDVRCAHCERYGVQIARREQQLIGALAGNLV